MVREGLEGIGRGSNRLAHSSELSAGQVLHGVRSGLILASIAQRFELHLQPGTEVQPQALFVLRPNRDLLMRFLC